MLNDMSTIIALILFALLSPVFIFLWILLSITSASGAIFKQKRVGYNKKEFIVYKFRTMENDRITHIGKYLRKTGLDEIPQLINIIKNQMAFVGPRPLTKYDIDRLQWNTPKCTERWSVRPGITGMAQLTTICSAEISLQNDLYYVRNKSIWLDIKIIWQSMLIPITGKKRKSPR